MNMLPPRKRKAEQAAEDAMLVEWLASAQTAEKRKALLNGTLVDAEVWTTKRMRQAALTGFLMSVAGTFEREFTRTVQNSGAAEVGCRV